MASSVVDEPPAFPLTTIWTPPCSSVFRLRETSTEFCAPPYASSGWVADGGYYSPGICFSGYTSGCEVTTSVEPSQTAAVCVPIGWRCHSHQRFATNAKNDSETRLVPAYEIRWGEADLTILETHPQMPTELPGATPNDNPWGPGDPHEGGEIRAAEKGLSRGAVAGITIGVTLLMLFICGVACLWYRKRYLKRPTIAPNYTTDERTGNVIGFLYSPKKTGSGGS